MSEQNSVSKSESPLPESQRDLILRLKDNLGDTLTPLPAQKWAHGLTYGVKSSEAFEVFQTLRDNPKLAFNMLVDITAVDWMDRREPRFDVVYQLLSLTYHVRLSLKIHVDEDAPEVPSVRPLWPAANFLEREVWDMFGIRFKGHGDLRRILMYDEFVGHPLRKDYPLRGKQPRVPLRVPELRNTSADMKRDELVALPVRQRLEVN